MTACCLGLFSAPSEHAEYCGIAIHYASIIINDHHALREVFDNTGAFNVGRLQQLTPTVQFYSSNARNSGVNIRGIGIPFGLTNDGIEQGVGIYVDDAYYSRAASATR